MSKKIAVIVGSLRKESLNKKLAHALIALAPASITPEIIEIADLPLYNQDFDDAGQAPSAWTRFREQMQTCQGVLFVTPEYNRTIPGALKNAIDVGSRPYGQNVWAKKPGAVISLSPGAIGGFGANCHLRLSIAAVGVPVLSQPEAYLGHAGNLFDAEGHITNEDTQKFLESFMDAYVHWVEINTRG